MSRDPTSQLWNAFDSGSSAIIVVFYADYGLRDEAIAMAESVAPPAWPVRRASTALGAAAHPHDLVLLIPDDEGATIDDLDGTRESFCDRDVPVVVFLLQGGEGAKRLPLTLGLNSWIRGSEIDTTPPPLDEEAERRAFKDRTGQTVERWLERYRAGELPSDNQTLAATYRALLLE
jgi:hypothetical protein